MTDPEQRTAVRRRPVARYRPIRSRPPSAHVRFLLADRDRALREWRRYEGTPQRELYRQLRERFLRRHARSGPWALDVGSGPGRFVRLLGGRGTRCVALDLSRAMLTVGRELASSEGRADAVPPVERVQGDALRAPFRPGAFAEIAVVGNPLGFEAGSGTQLLAEVEGLLAPRGTLIVEAAPGPGERSRYLARLPAGAVRRLLAAPLAALLPRVRREGFQREPSRHRPGSFRRWSVEDLVSRWTGADWHLLEVMAVAPALGPEAGHLQEVARDGQAWDRLLLLEETLGREPPRQADAAALLLAVERRGSIHTALS